MCCITLYKNTIDKLRAPHDLAVDADMNTAGYRLKFITSYISFFSYLSACMYVCMYVYLTSGFVKLLL